MCDVAHGFVDGVADYYGETIDFSEVSCMHKGAPSCQMVLTWAQ
jgi:predicted hydrocarbon binding protein